MATIFISYRRSDSASEAGRIYDRLVERYGRPQVFKDVDSIPPGVNFPDYIADSIGRSDVALVIIGPRWLNASSGFAQRRLDNSADFVRVEIETALRLGVPVIPVLVGGASLPAERRLPESLRPLLKQNGVQVRQDPDFTHDLERIFAAVNYWSAQPRRPAPTPTPTPKPVSTAATPAPSMTPSLGSLPPVGARRPASATALAEQLGIATKQTTTTRTLPRLRLAPLLSLVAALAVIAISTGLILNGTAERIFNPPNVPATQTAGAQAATQRALANTVSATETAQARLLTTPYTPKPGPGPCDTTDPKYSAQDQSYWFIDPSRSITCASDHKTVDMTAQPPNYWADLSFNGFPTTPSFPSTFTSTATITFTNSNDSSATCVDYTTGYSSNGGQATPGIIICRDGRWYSSSGADASQTYITASATYHLSMSVTPSNASYSINGQRLVGPIAITGQISELRVELTGAPSDSVAVSDFTLTPA